jgi:hypothetical protein
MIGIIVIGVCIIVMIKTQLAIRETDKRIKELEKELNEYYKIREQRLKDKGLV